MLLSCPGCAYAPVIGEREEARHYIGSADLMQRNLARDVEARAPVTDLALGSRLDEILTDDTVAGTLDADGAWAKVPAERGSNTHLRLQELAVERAGGKR